MTTAPPINELEQILQFGQQNGEFRPFDAKIMAIAIRAAIDGLPPRLAANPGLDLDACASELAMTFDLATRADEEAQEMSFDELLRHAEAEVVARRDMRAVQYRQEALAMQRGGLRRAARGLPGARRRAARPGGRRACGAASRRAGRTSG